MSFADTESLMLLRGDIDVPSFFASYIIPNIAYSEFDISSAGVLP